MEQLQRGLALLGGVETVGAFNEHRRPAAGGGVGSLRNLLSDTRWSTRELSRRARLCGAELVHHPIPALAPGSRLPQVITVSDLAFERLPRHFDRGYRTYARWVHRAAARSANAVVCISETTAADVRSLWGIAAERIVVAPLGAGQELRQASARSDSPRHFLYVGDAEPRKNLEVLLRAYSLYRQSEHEPLDLVLAGSASGRGPGVRVVAAPGSRELAELHAEAAALVHPSLYEGFGLTPLEAMSVGTPVLAARSPGVSEVCADAVLYAQADDPAEFARAMADIAGDASLRAELSERGRRRAAHFSWEECARRHLEAYSLALRA